MTVPAPVSHDFLVLAASLTAGEAAELLSRVLPVYVVIPAAAGTPGYRLCTRREMQDALARTGPGSTVGDAAAAARIPSASAVESGTDAPGDLEGFVVMEDGILAGVCDLSGAAPWDPSPPAEGSPERGAPLPADVAPAAAAEDGTARFCASFPERVAPGEAVSLLVWIGGEDDGATAAAALELDPTRPVEVLVQPGAGFVVEGRDEGELDAAAGLLATLRFRLRAVRPGVAKVRVFAFQDGRALAVLTLRPVVGPGASACARVEAAAPVEPPPAGAAPDVSVLVLERRENGLPVLELLVHARDPELGLFQRRFGPIALALEPLPFFNDFFREIEEEGERGATDPEQATRALEAKGTWLYETLVPAELREVLWRLRDRIRTVQVCSDEPWIPWELCRLTGEENGEVMEDDFFCARFQITRWLAGVPLRPRLSLRNVALVAPRDSALAAVTAEKTYFDGLAARGVAVATVPATASGVQQALAGGTFDGVHFSGHGVFRDTNPDRSAILLERGERLSPEAISGRLRNLGKASPLVFLNACEVGRGGRSLVDVGGFARRFVNAGAGAFVGAYWSVYDEPAGAFATALYDGLLAGETFGAAALHARLTVREAGDPTWLAYTVYADPSARVT
ncbi:MAG: hypothetical protein JWM27_3818 [Gemmatimonadetes bacterium]|nr:hypothetical protein [Gemmatimonadota bacterium]